MNLEEALKGISAVRYYRHCGYTYRCPHVCGHNALTFDELNPSMQKGIIILIYRLYKAQKIVYYYEPDFLWRYLKDCGVKINGVLDRTQIYDRRYKMTDERLRLIRMDIIRMVIQLLRYVVE